MMSASPIGFRHIDACADKTACYSLNILKPAIRQNSCGLYIVKSYGYKIIRRKDREREGASLSGWKVIYLNAFFIMTMYREKGTAFCLKRSLMIRHSSMIYTFYKYNRVLYSNVEKGMF